MDDCCCSAPEKWFCNNKKPTVETVEKYINNVIQINSEDIGLEYETRIGNDVQYMSVKNIINNYNNNYSQYISIYPITVTII